MFDENNVAMFMEEIQNGPLEPKTVEEYIDAYNQVLKHSWLQSAVEIKDFNPLRTADGTPLGFVVPLLEVPEPMNRFTFRSDCFTSLDGEIVEGGVRIIYNGHKKKHYPEDKPFLKFEPGQVATWEDLLVAMKSFVFIANDRFNNHGFYYESQKLLETQKTRTYKTLMIDDLTGPQRGHLAYRLDHNTCCGMLTASAVSQGKHGNLTVKEVFEKCGDRSSRSATILTNKVLKFRWFES